MEKAFNLSETKKLGFGLMRLPKIGGAIDLEKTKKLVDIFMSRGYTYFDTAYVYDKGESEIAARKCIVERYPRDSFTIATKFPVMKDATEEMVGELFNTSLSRLGVDYVDYYLIHVFNQDKYEIAKKIKLWEQLKEWKDKGIIRHLGFSTHESPEFIDMVLKEHPEVEFVQIQLNFLDWEDEKVQAHKNYDMIRSYDRPIVVMEPIKGGSLSGANEQINSLFKGYDPDSTPASWALRFAAGHEGIAMVLSGMNEIAQMEENTVTLDDPRPINEDEQKILDKVVDIYKSLEKVPCTRCRYCVDGCPMSIDIPSIIAVLNDYRVYKTVELSKRRYDAIAVKASQCLKCGACALACPQHIQVPEILEEAVKSLE